MAEATLRHQARLLGGLYQTGLLPKDEYVGVTLGVDRSLVVRWRSGERVAPLGALPILLSAIEDLGDRAAALRVLAAPLGLEVVVPVDDGAHGSACELVLALASATGRLADAAADGRIDAAEVASVTETANRLEAVANQLRALARRSAS
jgi:hypothetical protein